jgi:hypothetical protein
MISSETPYKLAEIIRDTWPGLYRNNMTKFKYPNDPLDSKCPHCGEIGKPCSNVDSMARAYARGACAKKHDQEKTE